MEIDFSNLLDDGDELPINPRDIFLTLDKEESFSFLRDIQADVLDNWFSKRDRQDTVIKLNVGSGKTLAGLLILQSSINEGLGPAVFVSPDRFLAEQAAEEATRLGIDVTTDEKGTQFRRGERILIVNIHKLFNGRSVFGVGAEGVKIPISSLIIDDVHACLASITEQFRIKVPRGHPLYDWSLAHFENALKQQSHSTFLSIAEGDPRYYAEVPFWAVQEHAEEIQTIAYQHRNTDELKFSYPFLADMLPLCRYVIGGKELHIEPGCPPTDMVNAFRDAKRRVYMTATLSDDSVLVTHFGADPDTLDRAVTAASSQAMGERMILMPQELNPNLSLPEIQTLLTDIAKEHNAVVIVPSAKSADAWRPIADQVLIGEGVSAGVARLRDGHVGLTVLINRYDGIDLPKDACRVLAIVDLPEATTLVERVDGPVLGNSTVELRRQIQRIEQGMGRGVRSADDYCVVLLYGSRLTERLLSPQGKEMLTSATQVQLNLSRQLAKQLQGASTSDLRTVMDHCLTREKGWTLASRKALLKAGSESGLHFDPNQAALRSSFDEARAGDHRHAASLLSNQSNATNDNAVKAWLKVRVADLTNFFDRSEAQRILKSAHKLHRGVLRPIAGVAYERLAPSKSAQAVAAQAFLRGHLEAPERILYAQSLVEALVFEADTAERFEQALMDAGKLIGITSQRPEASIGEGPDNLWVFRDGRFLIIECKNGSVSENGISKTELGQLGQSETWFKSRYGEDQPTTPVIVHPKATIAPPGTAMEGLRIITPEKLEQLRTALLGFVRSIASTDRLEDESRVRDALNDHNLSEATFLNQFSVRVKS